MLVLEHQSETRDLYLKVLFLKLNLAEFFNDERKHPKDEHHFFLGDGLVKVSQHDNAKENQEAYVGNL